MKMSALVSSMVKSRTSFRMALIQRPMLQGESMLGISNFLSVFAPRKGHLEEPGVSLDRL